MCCKTATIETMPDGMRVRDFLVSCSRSDLTSECVCIVHRVCNHVN